ncbi:MAG: fibronectin type III domain-containing protein [Candidatus Falkowbacteria bacterium]|nr:fibronectin type III domain-containing protein [Candidatus Falkowbacteria bacterium]
MNKKILVLILALAASLPLFVHGAVKVTKAPDPLTITVDDSFMLSSTNAVITWSANKLVDCYVNYGPVANLASNIKTLTKITASSKNRVFYYSTDLVKSEIDLKADYYYKVICQDDTNPIVVSPIKSLTRWTDLSINVNDNVMTSVSTATINYNANMPVTCQIQYSATSSLSKAKTVKVQRLLPLASVNKFYSMDLTGLVAGQNYYYKVICQNSMKESVQSTVRLLPRYIVPVHQLELAVNDNVMLSSSTVTIHYNTNLPTNCQVQYSLSSDLGNMKAVAEQQKIALARDRIFYIINLANLASSTDYYYRVICQDENSPLVQSEIKQLLKYRSLVSQPITQAETLKNNKAEKEAKAQFIKIYKRIPDMSSLNDVSVIKTMAYGSSEKVVNKNLKSEEAAAQVFKSVYGHIPSTADDWSVVRVIAYSGVERGVDTDGDLLTDDREKQLGTNPNKKDTDGDGYTDGIEVMNGYNPLK